MSDENSACWIPIRHKTLSDGDVKVCLTTGPDGGSGPSVLRAEVMGEGRRGVGGCGGIAMTGSGYNYDAKGLKDCGTLLQLSVTTLCKLHAATTILRPKQGRPVVID